MLFSKLIFLIQLLFLAGVICNNDQGDFQKLDDIIREALTNKDAIQQRLCVSMQIGNSYFTYILSNVIQRYLDMYNEPKRFEFLRRNLSQQDPHLITIKNTSSILEAETMHSGDGISVKRQVEIARGNLFNAKADLELTINFDKGILQLMPFIKVTNFTCETNRSNEECGEAMHYL